MVTYSAAKLKIAHAIQRTIESLEAKTEKLKNKITDILEGSEVSLTLTTKSGTRKMSLAGRRAIAAAQKLRWAKVKGIEEPAKKGKRNMSAAAKAKISAAAKLRWKKAKATGKN